MALRSSWGAEEGLLLHEHSGQVTPDSKGHWFALRRGKVRASREILQRSLENTALMIYFAAKRCVLQYVMLFNFFFYVYSYEVQFECMIL